MLISGIPPKTEKFKPDEPTLENRRTDITNLLKQTEFEIRQLKRLGQKEVTHYGIEVFSIEFLRQMLNYIQGLYNEYVDNDDNYDAALNKYLRALHGFETVNNRISLQCCIRAYSIIERKLAKINKSQDKNS